MPKFKSDSFAPDSELANAMVPVEAQEIRSKIPPSRETPPEGDIEGEFTVEEPSGFSCRNCRESLYVGSAFCPTCGVVFSLPTPNIKNVPDGYSPARAKVMIVVYKDRVTTAEVMRKRAIISPPVTNPLYGNPKPPK